MVKNIEITKVNALLLRNLDNFVQIITPINRPKKYKRRKIPANSLALMIFSTKNKIKTAGIAEAMEFRKNHTILESKKLF